MQKLVEGIHRFKNHVFASEKDFYASLVNGQSPETLFITCSDSRINPNLLTQTGPGELFILRNAGNIVPPYGSVHGGEAATIEYAVAVLNVRDIVVCGHSHCGAMEGLVTGKTHNDLPAVHAWLRYAEATRLIMKENYPHLASTDGGPSRELINATVQENALVQLEHLETHPVVTARLARRKLRLHAWFYKIDTAEVFHFDGKEGQYKLLTAITGDTAAASVPEGRSRAAAI